MNLDRAALRQGALVSLAFAVPFAVASRLVADSQKGSPWAPVLWLLALAGFVVGAGVAAWMQNKGLPLAHGLVCAGGTYFVAQAVLVVIKLVRGGTVHWLAIFFTFTSVLFAGLVGGGLGSILQKQGFTPGQRGRS